MSDDPAVGQGCKEFQEWTRRRFLKHSGATAAALISLPAWLPRVVRAADHTSTDTLVVVFLRGGMDGLTSVVPYGDPNLYSPNLRPNLAVLPPGNVDGAVDLDGFFGLAPALAPLLPAYQSGQLAIIHATGSPDPTRSHFDAFSFMEYGTPLQPLTLFTGWLARHLDTVPPVGSGLLRGIALSDIIPKTLAGAPATLPIRNPAVFGFPGRFQTEAERRAVLETAYTAANDPLAGAAESTFATIDLLETIDFQNYATSGGAVYPSNTFGQSLRSTAALIKAEVGVEVVMVELGGWDTHNQQGVLAGGMASLMDVLGSTLAAFHLDMQNQMNNLTVLVMSEFGRRADENGSLGTDHGHGNCMFVMGGHIAGGQVLADWTSNELLHPDLLHEGDSLAVTIEYRDIVAEIVQNRLGNTDLATVFPNYTPTFRGITM